MDAFLLFFQEGLAHITDFDGYDHMLFILALSLNFTYKDWKPLAILITAFTVGHSIALALSVFKVVEVDSDLIETLIPITILISALKHVVFPKSNTKNEAKLLYLITLFFGVIHGLGFSNYLNALFSSAPSNPFFENTSNPEPSIITELFAFNIGLEVGQLLILACIVVLQLFIIRLFSIKVHYYRLFLGILTSLVSLYLIFS